MAAIASRSDIQDFQQDGDLLNLFRQEATKYGDVSEPELLAAYKQLVNKPGGPEALATQLRCATGQEWKKKDMLSGWIKLTSVRADFQVDNKKAAIKIDGEAVGYFYPQSTNIYGDLYYNDLRGLYGERPCYIYTQTSGGRKRFVVDIYENDTWRTRLASYKVLDPPYDVDGTAGQVNITRPPP